MDDLLNDLTDPQRVAVQHGDGPLLILAGPGSGKTRVVTRRAAHLARTIARPHQILAITFTNKAANEMRERISSLGAGQGMTICTFHALCAKHLRIDHERANVPRNFTIFNTDDRRKLIKRAIEECGFSTANLQPAVVEARISQAKNELMTADAFAAQSDDWSLRRIAMIYTAYEKIRDDMGGLDFDDLLMRMAHLVQGDEDYRNQLSERYRYVMVDEYQDTNAAQYLIARQLAQQHSNLCVTGDPDQSIYGWRGADIQNILSFERDYPAAKVVRLEQNFRSTKRILAAADALIAGNTERKVKSLWTDNDAGPAVRVMEFERGGDEAAAIGRAIAQQIQQGACASDIAVFYRVNSLSRVLEEALLREGVAYQIARGVEFYNRKEIRDVLGYLRVLVNPADEVALLRIINTPARGIGATTIKRLVEFARTHTARTIDLLSSDEAMAVLGRSSTRVREFGQLLRALAPVVALPAPKALETVLSQTGLRAMYHALDPNGDGPMANLNELLSAATDFYDENPDTTIIHWLEYAALLGDVDAVKAESESVTLMTLHAAKGLEFDTVFIIGLEDGLLPFRRHDDAGVDEEEERRLCFVGITRAKRQLTLSRARLRMMRGMTERTVRSPFLDELPSDAIEWLNTTSTARASKSVRRGGSLPSDVDDWTVGTLVKHPVRGLGQIMALERGRRRTHVDVQFEDGSQQSWVLEFADLTRVDHYEVGGG